MPKSKTGKLKRLSKRTSSVDNNPASAQGIDKIFADIHRAMSDKQFESIEEANQFLQDTFMSRGGNTILAARSKSVKEEAEDLVYEAWDASGKRRLQLARKALELFKDCADAYVLFCVNHQFQPNYQRLL